MSIANELSSDVVASAVAKSGGNQTDVLKIALLLHSTLRALSQEEKRRSHVTSFPSATASAFGSSKH